MRNKKPSELKIIVFSGGTGSNSITDALVSLGIHPILLVNAYDDGKSTGDIRKKFGILGPSDIAKNIAVLSPVNLRKLLEIRISKGNDAAALRADFFKICDKDLSSTLGLEIKAALDKLNLELQTQCFVYLNKFKEKMLEWEAKNTKEIYDLNDYGFRNIIYVGALFMHATQDGVIDYHKTNDALKEIFKLNGDVILNNEESLQLIGITVSGKLLNSEAAIVDMNKEEAIAETFLWKAPLNKDEIVEFEKLAGFMAKKNYLANRAIYPEVSAITRDAIMTADLIIFAPTTYHSSLEATLYTRGIPEALQATQAPIIGVGNLAVERGLPVASEEHAKITARIGRDMTYFLMSDHGFVAGPTIPVDKQLAGFANVVVAPIAKNSMHHDGPAVVEKIMELAQQATPDLNKQNTMMRHQVTVLLSDPHTFEKNKDRIKKICLKILAIDRLDQLRSKFKVVIMGAGNGTRLYPEEIPTDQRLPKVLYPINGRANLDYLLDLLSPFDHEKKPLVVSGQQNHHKISTHAPERHYTEVGETRGPGGSLLSVEQHLHHEEKIILVWGDSGGLISPEQIQLLLLVHEAMGADITIPSSWEPNPYAGITRDVEGHFHDIFTTKGKEVTRPGVGEHDGSLFILNCETFFQKLHELDCETPKGKEVGVLEAFPKLAKTTVVVRCLEPQQALGYNTANEARLVAYYRQYPTASFIDPNSILAAATADGKFILQENSKIQYVSSTLKINAQAVVFDIDETIATDGKIDPDCLKMIIEIAKTKPVAFITVRTEKSLEKMLFEQLKTHSNYEKIKNNIYVYPENGAYGFNLANPNNKFYECPMSESAGIGKVIALFEKYHIIAMHDKYKLTAYKMQFWLKNCSDILVTIVKINCLMELMLLPFRAYQSNDDSFILSYYCRPSIGPANDDKTPSVPYAFHQPPVFVVPDYLCAPADGKPDYRVVNKGTALLDFCVRTHLDINQVVKFADMGRVFSADGPLFVGDGCVCVGNAEQVDRLTSSRQYSTVFQDGLTGAEAVKNILPRVFATVLGAQSVSSMLPPDHMFGSPRPSQVVAASSESTLKTRI